MAGTWAAPCGSDKRCGAWGSQRTGLNSDNVRGERHTLTAAARGFRITGHHRHQACERRNHLFPTPDSKSCPFAKPPVSPSNPPCARDVGQGKKKDSASRQVPPTGLTGAKLCADMSELALLSAAASEAALWISALPPHISGAAERRVASHKESRARIFNGTCTRVLSRRLGKARRGGGSH